MGDKKVNGIRNLKGISITSFYKNLRKVMFYILVIFTMVILLKSASAEILVESDHPYANNYANTWTISEPGASQIRIHFSKIDIIKNDYVKILDKDGKELRIYGKSYYNDYTPYLIEDFWTEWFVGDTLKVKFTANSIGTSYGFLVDQKETRETSSTPTPLSTPVIPSKTTPTPTYISTTIAYPSGEGATPTPRIPDGNIDINMILSFIGVLATIIGVYFGYRATKKK